MIEVPAVRIASVAASFTSSPLALAPGKVMSRPTIARIWRGRTRRDVADVYETYLRREGIPPLERTALGVQLFREDRETETEFITISYWADVASMANFTGGDPTRFIIYRATRNS
jgi:hypothetical protein